MAVAVPLLLSATGASAAIAGAMTTAFGLAAGAVTAGMVTVGAGVLTAVSGVGDKINRAASKVFGEDLVKAANIGGAIYMAYDMSGGLSGGGESATVDPGLGDIGGFPAPTEGALASASIDPSLGDIGGFPNSMASPQSASSLSKVVESGKNLLDKGVKAWSASDPRTKAAWLQVGGNVMQGALSAKAEEDAMRARWEHDDRYRSGPAGGSKWASWMPEPVKVPRP